MDLIGIENEAEFFLLARSSDVLEVELQDITNRWSKDLEGTNPLTRLTSSAEAYTRVYRQLLNTTDKSVRAELYAELTSRAANALGYEVKRASETLALDSGSLSHAYSIKHSTQTANPPSGFWKRQRRQLVKNKLTRLAKPLIKNNSLLMKPNTQRPIWLLKSSLRRASSIWRMRRDMYWLLVPLNGC